MKIILISHFFPPTHNAGAEKRTLGYARELYKLGHSVQVVCVGEWGRGQQYWNGIRDEIYQDISVRRIDLNWTLAPNPNRYLYDNPVVEEQLDLWLDEWQPDIVHIISCLTLSASIIRSAKKKKLPVVFTLTDFWSICPKISLVRHDQTLCDGRTTSQECLQCMMAKTRIYRLLATGGAEKNAVSVLHWLSKLPILSRVRGLRGMLLNMDERKAVLSDLIGKVDFLTAPSAFLADIIRKSGKMDLPIQVIYSGHDLSWLETLPPKRFSNKVRFGFIGQITPVKGLHILVAAFLSAGLAQDAQLLIFGDAGYQPDYTGMLTNIAGDCQNILWMGKFSHDQLGAVLSQIDVLVIPSQWHENNPRVMQEAFAAQIPVIASNVGGISEFVHHEVNGLSFEYDREDELAECLRRFTQNPGLIQKLQEGIQAPRTIEKEITDLVQVYQSLLSQ